MERDLENVFVSYSHSDSQFVNRLIEDMRYASIPVIYDRWLLNIGDSIIDKISQAVTGSAVVVPVLSKKSVESNWVKKELSLAMTGEVNEKKVKVFPVKIDDCAIPPSISDKLYADCKLSYYFGLRRLLESISPNTYDQFGFQFSRKNSIENLADEFRRILGRNNHSEILYWIEKNNFVLAGLLGELWDVSEALKNFSFNDGQTVDYMVVSGQSFRYAYSAVKLLDGEVSSYTAETLANEVRKLSETIKTYYNDETRFRGLLSIRLCNGYGASQILDRLSLHKLGKFDIVGKILLGRRDEYDDSLNSLRNKLYSRTPSIEIISYDRILDALKGLRRY